MSLIILFLLDKNGRTTDTQNKTLKIAGAQVACSVSQNRMWPVFSFSLPSAFVGVLILKRFSLPHLSHCPFKAFLLGIFKFQNILSISGSSFYTSFDLGSAAYNFVSQVLSFVEIVFCFCISSALSFFTPINWV